MMKNFYFSLFLLLVTGPLMGQTLVEATLVASQTKSEVTDSYNLPSTLVTNGIHMFKVTYITPSINNQPDTASGLVVIPDIVGTFPLLCYQHGTVNSREDVPSRINEEDEPKGDPLPAPLSAFGYVVAAPDYLGLGDSPGFHPYVHAETEASAAVNLLFAAREFLQTQSVSLNDQLFITGYSQGGHAALAAYRSIQQDYPNDFTVTAVAPMSGPYSISGAMTDVILSDEAYFFTGYLPYTLLSYNLAYDLFDDLGDYFKEPYATPIRQFAAGDIDLGTLNGTLSSQLSAEVGGVYPKRMLQDSILAVAESGSETHPLMVALKANDVFDWQPMAPTRMYYCMADDQVTYRNSIIADSVMQLNNAPDVGAIDVNPFANHGACADPATISTVSFFAEFQEYDINTSTNDLGSADDLLRISPNPIEGNVEVIWEGGKAQLELYNNQGQLLNRLALGAQETTTYNVSHLPAGIYFVHVTDGKLQTLRKVVKR